MNYRRCGKSGVLLPELSLGLWQNFGEGANPSVCKSLIARCLDTGIVHFDLANNYGPPPGAAESCFGQLLNKHFATHRDEMFISTKAGHLMWEGPYGDWGSRKHLLASLDQSLHRMGLDYVDVFYSHRPDPETPIEETVGALVQAVRSGKALYVGLSKYQPKQFRKAVALLKAEKIPCLLHQIRYNLLDRSVEDKVLPAIVKEETGSIAFSPLAQGQLTGKYVLGHIPRGSRAQRENCPFLNPEQVHDNNSRILVLQQLAKEAGMSLTHLAIRWLLHRPEITSVLIGARTLAQLDDCISAIGQEPLPEDLLKNIEIMR